jgi:beta-glucosidase
VSVSDRAASGAPDEPRPAGPVVLPPVNVVAPDGAANFRFPDGFLWGAATSAHQVEGNNFHNDWWAWEQAGRVATPSGLACDHWNRYRTDFDLAQSLGHNAHRFSIEWSRVEPEEGQWDDTALDHYRDVLLALHERGIEPVVTLLHYTLPHWLADKGGWEHSGIEGLFERYVTRVMKALAPHARWWITINEPVVQVFKGWLIGQWPPGKVRAWTPALKVLRHMLRAHVRAYHVIHSHRRDAMVGIAKHALALSPDDPTRRLDRWSVRVRGYLFNHLFLEALHTGVLRVPGLFWERLPVARTLDFIGVNYYTRDFVRNTGYNLPGLVGELAHRDHRQQRGKLNDLGWEVFPEGLAQFLREYSRYKLPILVTENGIPTRHDDDRWVFLFMHLWQVARAIADGVHVVGYLHWSLLDNFEWADGYGGRFGLIEVDFDTQERRIRPSAWRYAQIIRRNEL